MRTERTKSKKAKTGKVFGKVPIQGEVYRVVFQICSAFLLFCFSVFCLYYIFLNLDMEKNEDSVNIADSLFFV